MKNFAIIISTCLLCLYGCKDKEASPVQATDGVRIEKGIHPLEDAQSLDVLINEIGDAKYVLLGEASHGTSEYYTWRAEITKRLIQEKEFTLIAVEGDWPASYQVNQYVKGQSNAGSAKEVLSQFNRWPTWMWANEEIVQLTEWLKSYNNSQMSGKQVGFYGLDVYSLWESVDAILAYMDKTDPQAAIKARAAYQCLAAYNRDEQAYASATLQQSQLCADELATLLQAVQASMAAQPVLSAEAKFNVEQNALVAVNAERYYHAMVRSDTESWNIRDRHMAQTINRLMALHGPEAKIIVWEHNTHVGDARATDMAQSGMVNVGQLVREEHSQEGVYIVGFGSYSGSVIAASAWGAPMREMKVPEAPDKTWEAILHHSKPENKIVLLDELASDPVMMQSRGHRAIGVVYNPNAERGNYVPTVLPQRYDAFLFIDKTTALHPLSSTNGRISAASLSFY